MYPMMQLEFVPVDEFYFALTLAVRTLADVGGTELVAQVQAQLQQQFGRASTIAAAQQNTFNYVFRVLNYDNAPADQLIVSIADWQGKLRLSSDYGWVLDNDRKPARTEKFARRDAFTQELCQHLQQWLQIPLDAAA